MEHTTLSQMCRSRIGKHLHMRGAYGQALATEAGKAETSPHPWSIRDCVNSIRQRFGNISTSVEHTRFVRISRRGTEKHLHIRGAYRSRNRRRKTKRETSPHPWSILTLSTQFHPAIRNISTSVEHTTGALYGYFASKKHLHIRGAYSNI